MNPPTTTDAPRAFHGDQKIKDKLLARIAAHEEADAIISGTYGRKEGGIWKGCAVGCSVHDLKQDKRLESPHSRYPDLLGIPVWIAYLEDGIFEAMSADKRTGFPRRFAEAIPVGADFDGLADRLAIRRLKEECLPLSGQWPKSVRAEVVAAIEKTIAALESGDEKDRSAARSAAAWAARSAESAAGSAAWAAESAAARSAAWAARSARSAAAWAAESAAWAGAAESAAAWAAESAAARSAAWAAESAFDREADRLVSELEALPVSEPVAA